MATRLLAGGTTLQIQDEAMIEFAIFILIVIGAVVYFSLEYLDDKFGTSPATVALGTLSVGVMLLLVVEILRSVPDIVDTTASFQ